MKETVTETPIIHPWFKARKYLRLESNKVFYYFKKKKEISIFTTGICYLIADKPNICSGHTGGTLYLLALNNVFNVLTMTIALGVKHKEAIVGFLTSHMN